MTVFDIQFEKGFSRRLISENSPPTPWLLKSSPTLNINGLEIHQIILSKRGYLPLHNPWRRISDEKEFDTILATIPEWSILSPRLYPASKDLQKSLKYELNLFLDRLDDVVLPDAFGLLFDPLNNSIDYLNDLLSYNPSIIGVRYPPLEDSSPRKFVNDLIKLRKKIPANVAIYLPGSGGIGFQTLLVTLGIDILDDHAAYRAAARNRGYIDGMIHYTKDFRRDQLIENNIDALQLDFENILYHLTKNTIWTRLAREMHTHPSVASAVKLIGKESQYKIPLEKFAKFEGNDLQFTGPEGLSHPDVLAFQKRLLNRYQLAPETKIVVLLPCSARKPYAESYSHKKYNKAIAKGAKGMQASVNVWSLTSPLGVVPRELETVYPAQNYDIPVTGDWTIEEIEKCGNLLGEMLSKLPNHIKVIAHVSKGYREMIDYAQNFKDMIVSWADSNSKSPSALKNLSKLVEDTINSIQLPEITEKLYYIKSKNTIQSITRFHHGENVTLDFDPNRIRFVGRPPRPIQVQKDKQHWITWDKLSGNVRLSHRVVPKIALETHNWILLNADKLRGSNLFGIAIKKASEFISPGDEVIFFNADKTIILGIGVAKISGISMNQVNSGLVATIRKKMNLNLQKL